MPDTKKKDGWDKTSILCGAISGVGVAALAVVGFIASRSLEARQHELRLAESKLQELELFEKFMPHLEAGGIKQRAAILSIRDIAGIGVSLRYAEIHGGEGTMDALLIMQQEAANDSDRRRIRNSYISLLRRNPENGQVASGATVWEDKQVTNYRTEARTRTVPVQKYVPETRTRTVPVQRTRQETRVRSVEVADETTGEKTTREETYTVDVPYTETVEQTYTVRVPVMEEVTQTYTVNVPSVETRTIEVTEYADPDVAAIAQSIVAESPLDFEQLVRRVAENVGAATDRQVDNLRRRLAFLVQPGSASINLTQKVTSVDPEPDVFPSLLKLENNEDRDIAGAQAESAAPSVFPSDDMIPLPVLAPPAE